MSDKCDSQGVTCLFPEGIYIPRPPSFAKGQLPGTKFSQQHLIEHRQRLYKIVKDRMKGVLFEGIEPQESLGRDIKNIIKKNVSSSIATFQKYAFFEFFSGKIIEQLIYGVMPSNKTFYG